ncbi:type I-E CRISPR-associated protein Cas6/Cse3/CasE [Proteus vulgaris]|uniref:type I-E CRISPR-associated protein Cas6/Cse3/CasE n=1 Tax=Proteus TaxID=583 RepID=UPI000D696B55|nr:MULTISPECIES: type I-E CRISPR-associated protein Cas6/Cse3/CasE [Proteus]MBQ0213335.1 type I-E CRISPR-associated protein Cas6/Cse3/CasE [Proteus vulgaris]UDN34732.1 type I-E CRISPR-associated protein Cas6/Cse3/CasE [Proteus sp. NMG38-2]
MYLSRITIGGSSDYLHSLLTNKQQAGYTIHQLLWQLFTEEKERSFLYRIEIEKNGTPIFYILSSVTPAIKHAFFKIETKPFLPKLAPKMKLAFSLRANPTVCITDKEGKQHRHDVLMHAKKQAQLNGNYSSHDDIQHLMQQAALNWITSESRLNKWGISLTQLPDIKAYTPERIKKPSGKIMAFSSVDYQGVLTIEDPHLFWQQYQQGFGRAKAFGCGLMLIRSI